MWGSVSRAAKCLRSANVSKSVINSLKKCDGVLNPIQQHTCVSVVQPSVFRFSPRSITEIIDKNKAPSITEFPVSRLPLITPRSIVPLIGDVVPKRDLTLPAVSDHEVHAARLIVIRRKKMRTHKRRKLKKKMRSRWHQLKQRRRIRREKAFRAELLAMVKDSEAFSAEQYVADKIAQANHTPLPKRWKGKRLPAFVIRQLMGLEPKVNFKHTEFYKA